MGYQWILNSYWFSGSMVKASDVKDSTCTRGAHEYPNIHSVHTHVIKYGELDEKRRLVLVIPGNPGAIEFYDQFMSTLHQSSGWPVWGMSHAGHSIVPKHAGWNDPNPEVFTLEGQIEHKLYFINEYLPEDVEIVLIGHSIGAYVVLEMMERLHSDQVTQGILLFPTIEKMAESPQGKRVTPLLKYWSWLLIFIAALLWLLPLDWRTKMIQYVFSKRQHAWNGPLPDCMHVGALSVINPYCAWKTTHMANIEMREVDELKESVVERQLPKLRFYYGASDHWCPRKHYYKMKELFPRHDKIELCTSGHRHAFIIDASEPMAAKVSGWLKSL